MPDGGVMAHVTFCDDVRQETTGKLLLIGCYQHYLYVAEMPAVLPMCLVMNTSAPLEPRLTSFGIRVLFGDAVIHENSLTSEQIEQAFTAATPPPQSGLQLEPIMSIDAILRLGLLHIEQPTALRVLVTMNDVEIEAGRLHLLLPPAP